YSIDIQRKSFSSKEDLVEHLVKGYSDELAAHYNLSSLKENEASARSKQSEVAIVGIACKFPEAGNHREFWNNLIDKKNSIREIPKSRWDTELFYDKDGAANKTISKWGALIENVKSFDPDFFGIPSDDVNLIDPQERLLYQEVYNAFQDAGLDVSKFAGSNTGVFVGYEYAEYEHFLRKNQEAVSRSLHFGSASQTYYFANRISFLYDLCGPSEAININCASSAIAISSAYYSLLNKESDLAVACGVSLNLFADDYVSESQYGLLSPTGKCAVFDDAADGFTRGEGVAVVVLKRLEDAIHDQDRIYSVVKSCHQNNRGKSNSLSDVKYESLTNVITGCYEKADIKPEDISYIELDGYASKWADSFEFEGIKGVFDKSTQSRKHCGLGSLKGNIGHLEPASGIASVIKVALSLYNKRFPATITKNKVNEFIDIGDLTHPLYFADETILFENIRSDASTRIRAGVNSFADSGVNLHILLEEYQDDLMSRIRDESDTINEKHLFVLSAKNITQLKAYVKSYIEFLATESNLSFIDLIYTLQTGREELAYRLAIVVESVEELLEKLKTLSGAKTLASKSLQKQRIYYGDLSILDQDSNRVSVSNEDDSGLDKSLLSSQWAEIAEQWICGAQVPWEKIWMEKRANKVSLPSYPFSDKEYWLDLKTVNTKEIHAEPSKESSNPESKLATTKIIEKSKEYVAPRNDVEKVLIRSWAEVLDVKAENISINDGFIELGGDSILAMQVVSILRKELDTNFPLKVFFDVNTVADTAEVINAYLYKQELTTEFEDADLGEFEEGSL
ncbi:MAG: beta-ketoacyl synthase N-terminal-like domain-containing protein, partial [Kangiellaceae bacterium]|nr:beta-ketoacyl synthase N-terminal-like domain-containing protein [Kangiellaceae bacterium]